MTSVRLTQEEFLRRSKQVHGNTYDYSDTVYKQGRELVAIRCKEHGVFSQKPFLHMSGGGCRSCYEKRKILTTSDFIKKAKLVHGSRYSYNKSVYSRSKDKIEIECHKHGSFFQLANHHLCGSGCPHCFFSGGKKYSRKSVTLCGKSFQLQGYEPEALQHLVFNLGISPTLIKVGDDVPIVKYRQEGKWHKHYPDFWIPKRNQLVEVKSGFTFFFHLENLKAKRNYAIKTGYKYSVFLIDDFGKKLNLPRNWYKITEPQLRRVLCLE